MGSRWRTFIIAGLLGSTSVLSGCAADPADTGASDGGSHGSVQVESEPLNKIAGSVSEWSVKTTANRAYSGDVTFAITNFGTVPHEFLVVKTDYEPGKIPLGSDNRFSEDGSGLEVIDEIAEFEVNTTGLLKVALEPGKYQLLCNIAGHYKAGMWTGLEVVKGEKPFKDSSPESASATDKDAVSNDVAGSVAEWAVTVDAVKAKAGEVAFSIENRGTIDHEFLVVKTTYEHGMIPVGENNRLDEENPGITVIDEIKEWKPGSTGTLKVKLEPGKYELLCNIEGHYKNGMHSPFEVIE